MAFNLRIFESEFKEIKDFVLSYPNIETGGDLFGLWKANGDPVVQLIIGPGKNCRRTSVSFHQDTDYLARVGTYVNTSFMLCHIGSWHSHHQLSLSQPSAGDRSTVCNNFPEGLKRYIMIIANITRGASSRQSVVIHPYMFTNGGHVCKKGRVDTISLRSPFREVGYVVSCIGNGAEQPGSTKDAYSSRAPLEYHNRPSTRSKPISGAPRNFQTISSNRESHSPKKVDKNVNQPSTWSKHHHDQPKRSNPVHQNYISTDSTVEPMDVDPPDYRTVNDQQSTKLQHQVAKNHETRQPTQWYETEEGGTILKEIIREITTTMTSDIDYSRHPHSKNLTMQFTHYRQKWTINYPESFGDEPALISNSMYGNNVPSKNVIKDIRKACKCTQCRTHETTDYQHSPPSPQKQGPLHTHSIHNNPPPSHSRQDSPPSPIKQSPTTSPSKQVHQPSHSRRSPTTSPSKQGRFTPYQVKRPQSRKEAKSPPQPWYNTSSGKLIVEEFKAEIENYLQNTNNSGKVKIQDNVYAKQLTVYHNSRDWIMEFIDNPSKDIELKIYGEKKHVAKLRSPSDAVSKLKQNCSCTYCRSTRRSPSAGQRRQGSALTRPNSRYGVNVDRRPPTRGLSTSTFFATEKGEEKFRKICTQINTLLLHGRNVDISRVVRTKDIQVTFEHNRMHWKIKFPFKFPEKLPDVSYGVNQFTSVSVSNDDVLRAIRNKCNCSSCKPAYSYIPNRIY